VFNRQGTINRGRAQAGSYPGWTVGGKTVSERNTGEITAQKHKEE